MPLFESFPASWYFETSVRNNQKQKRKCICCAIFSVDFLEQPFRNFNLNNFHPFIALNGFFFFLRTFFNGYQAKSFRVAQIEVLLRGLNNFNRKYSLEVLDQVFYHWVKFCTHWKQSAISLNLFMDSLISACVLFSMRYFLISQKVFCEKLNFKTCGASRSDSQNHVS